MKPLVRRSALTAAVILVALRTAAAQGMPDRDVRDIVVGMPVAAIPEAGYADLACADDADRKLSGWSGWRECPADAHALHAVRFGFDPQTSRDGTVVAGHPVVLTALIDDLGNVAGLRIDTDPAARLYKRKKAFLFGAQVMSRYGSEGWTCTQRQPEADEQPVGGVFLRESCTKSGEGRVIVVRRELFRHASQDPAAFVDQTQVAIAREGE